MPGEHIALPSTHTPLPTDPFVKVYLLQDGRKMSKKKTAVKRDDPNPVFNEAMIFSVPAIVLQVRARASEEPQRGRAGGTFHGGTLPDGKPSLSRAVCGHHSLLRGPRDQVSEPRLPWAAKAWKGPRSSLVPGQEAGGGVG